MLKAAAHRRRLIIERGSSSQNLSVSLVFSMYLWMGNMKNTRISATAAVPQRVCVSLSCVATPRHAAWISCQAEGARQTSPRTQFYFWIVWRHRWPSDSDTDAALQPSHAQLRCFWTFKSHPAVTFLDTSTCKCWYQWEFFFGFFYPDVANTYTLQPWALAGEHFYFPLHFQLLFARLLIAHWPCLLYWGPVQYVQIRRGHSCCSNPLIAKRHTLNWTVCRKSLWGTGWFIGCWCSQNVFVELESSSQCCFACTFFYQLEFFSTCRCFNINSKNKNTLIFYTKFLDFYSILCR